LKEQEKILTAQFNQVTQELLKKSSEYSSRVSERRSLLDTVIAQIKEKREQPVVEFLMDVGKILSSCKAAEAPIPELLSPELQRSIESLSEISQLVVDTVDKFKASTACCFCHPLENVTLDPETASPFLTLSRDHKTVWFGDERQNLPDTPKRFTGSPSVLGSQG
ncbi:TRI15 protein, partial [Thryothorus ludovicianus]|nr:TRI15 protein [Thryothorus ludovicianus]